MNRLFGRQNRSLQPQGQMFKSSYKEGKKVRKRRTVLLLVIVIVVVL